MSTLLPGLVSITFRKKSPQEIIDLCVKNRLQGIEWGGDIHAPHGDLQRAADVRQRCQDAGVKIAAYGSYYSVGYSEPELPFERVLETAVTLNAPLIRVWAGKKNAEDADKKYFSHIVEESQRIGDLAQQAGIALAYEFHGNTLNNNAAASKVLFQAINHDAWQTLWQPLATESLPQSDSLRSVLPRLSNLHVFHWENNKHADCRLLSVGADAWKKYFSIVQNDGNNTQCWALLEFVLNGVEESLQKDAATLIKLLGGAESLR